MRPPAVKIVRARQRDRASSLPGFDRNFPPQTREWGIDKLQLKLTGQWRTTLADGRAFFATRLSDPALPWLRNHDANRGAVTVETVQPSLLTLSLKISATRCSETEGAIVAELSANPTRTLASLIARFGDQEDFRARIFSMDVLTFFGIAVEPYGIPRSLDGSDNYLPDRPPVRSLLGDDPFATFIPTYIAQLQILLSRTLSEYDGGFGFDGSDQVIASPDGVIRLSWGQVAVPQIETYFERFHRNAIPAVRGAAVSILDADTASRVTLYPAYQEQPSLERDGDRLALTAAISSTVDGRHTLAVYAKTPSRIRFEVRRQRRGRYGSDAIGNRGASCPPHMARLVNILLTVERQDAARLIRWTDFFEFFDEPDLPSIGDLAYVMRAIFRAANGSAELFDLLTERLLVDGGLAIGINPQINIAAIRYLERAGVIEKGRIRHRYSPSQIARYRLVGIYRSLRERMLMGISGQSGADMTRAI